METPAAFVAATDMTHALRETLWDADDRVRFTIGRFEVLPGGMREIARGVAGGQAFPADLVGADDAALFHETHAELLKGAAVTLGGGDDVARFVGVVVDMDQDFPGPGPVGL